MVTYEGYDLSDTPRPGQQSYRLRFEPIDGGAPFYLDPVVYPMLTSSGPDNIQWSVDPDVRTGWMSDIYIYVAGSKYVEKKNEEVEEAAQSTIMPVTDQAADSSEVKTIELSKDETATAGPFTFRFIDFTPASEESVPENTQIGIRSLVRVTHEPSGTAYDVEPLFAVYTEEGQSFTYSPALPIDRWDFEVMFTRINPETDSIELSVVGLDEEFQEDWVLVVAEKKPFVSVVWLGTFLLMIGFSISIMRHWKREKDTGKKNIERL